MADTGVDGGVSPVGRAFHAVTALVSLAAVVLQLVLGLLGIRPEFVPDVPRSPATIVVQFVSYFTIESNLLVVASCGALALRGRPRTTFGRVVRLDAVVGIVVTGVVYATLLGPGLTYSGANLWANAGLHYATPVLALVGFLVFEPRGGLDARVVRWSLVWPAAYVAWTLGHGALTRWYPYPFVDVTRLGYPAAIRNGAGLVGFILLVAALAWAYDRATTRRRRLAPG